MKQQKKKWKFDQERITNLKALGYDVKIVWENDYIENEEKTIQECKEFLGVN